MLFVTRSIFCICLGVVWISFPGNRQNSPQRDRDLPWTSNTVESSFDVGGQVPPRDGNPEQGSRLDLVIENCTVVSLLDGKLTPNQSIHIRGGTITYVGAKRALPSAGHHVIDGSGKFVMPGLIDMHAHHAIHEGMLEGRNSYDQMAIGAISAERLRDYLDQGFTSTRDAGGNVCDGSTVCP